MTYAVTNPPALIVGFPMTGPGRIWMYRSTDAATTADDTGYFTNGYDLGMRVGDVVLVFDTDTSDIMTIHRVITATAGGAVTISQTGLTIT